MLRLRIQHQWVRWLLWSIFIFFIGSTGLVSSSATQTMLEPSSVQIEPVVQRTLLGQPQISPEQATTLAINNPNNLAQFRISALGADGDPMYDATSPAVAYNPDLDEYLVVWTGSLTPGELEIFGQRLKADGTPVGPKGFRISFMGPDGDTQYEARNPAITYRSQTRDYLVVWAGTPLPNEFEIFGQRLNGEGQPIANNMRMTRIGPDGDPRYDAHHPVVACDTEEGACLLVFEADNTPGEREIFARQLNTIGQPVSDLRISITGVNGNPQYAARHPAIVYHHTRNEYLVVWEATADVIDEFEIYGQLITREGQLIGRDRFRISDIGLDADAASDALNPAVTYNTESGNYLVVWEGPVSRGEFEIFGQLLEVIETADSRSLVRLEPNDFSISRTGPSAQPDYDALNPSVAFNRATNEFLVTWEATTDVIDEFEIFGQRLYWNHQFRGGPFQISMMGPEGNPAYDAEHPTVIANHTQGAHFVVWQGDNDTGALTDEEFEIYGRHIPRSPTWLALLYISSDDQIAGQISGGQTTLTASVKRLETHLRRMPYNPAMQLVVLIDGPTDGDSTIYVRKPDDLVDITDEVAVSRFWSDTFPPNHELDMGNTRTLQSFVDWAHQTYPSIEHTFLSIIDHGGGWSPDFGNGVQPPALIAFQSGGWRGVSLDFTSNSSFSTRGTREVFEGLGDSSDIDVLFFDACLMGMVESTYEVSAHVDYMVAGQNLLWSQLPYEQYLDRTMLTASTTPELLAKSLVQHYNQPARPEEPFTIAAIDARRLPEVAQSVDTLAQALLNAWDAAADPATVTTAIRTAYTATQKFDYDSSLQIDATEGYVDLAHFAQHIREQDIAPTVNTAADAVVQSVGGYEGADGAVIERQMVSGTPLRATESWNLDQAYGLSIYLPLGERDCRPTGPIGETTDPACVLPDGANDTADGAPAVENQLAFYTKPGQLAFTGAAPNWAAFLTRLDETTDIPIRNLKERPFTAPLPARSWSRIYLPLVE